MLAVRPFVSKTDFMAFAGCPAYAWLCKHRPQDVPVETDPLRLRRIADGNAVEALARRRFPDGVLIDTLDVEEAVAWTSRAIAGGARAIFQATVLTEAGLLARADVLVRGDDAWDLIEIKASNTVDTGHRLDATFQALAFTQAGFALRSVQVMYLDRTYRRSGMADPYAMLQTTNITADVDTRLETFAEATTTAVAVLTDPATSPACRCDRTTRGRRCPTFARFHPHIPEGKTVYDIADIQLATLLPVLDRGIVAIGDWPLDHALTRKQQRQVDVHRSGVEHVDRRGLAAFHEALDFPLYFLDYETVDSGVPLFDGHWPWFKMPFQYSLHVVEADGRQTHREFLWTERDRDPVPHIAAALMRDIGPAGSIVVWNKTFEAKCNRAMVELVPAARDHLLDLNERMVDLADVVARGLWTHPRFGGRWSIKVVLPVAAPDLAYEALEIGNGSTACVAWANAMIDDPGLMTDAERTRTFDALRAYCGVDSLAMVRIWEHTRRLAGCW